MALQFLLARPGRRSKRAKRDTKAGGGEGAVPHLREKKPNDIDNKMKNQCEAKKAYAVISYAVILAQRLALYRIIC